MTQTMDVGSNAEAPRDHKVLPPFSLTRGAIPCIDGLRAISVLLVMLSHYGNQNRIPGALGVSTFFFISGFLITTLMARESNRSGDISIRNFYARRFLRLQPELLCFIIISSVAGAFYLGEDLPRLPAYVYALLYVSNYAYIYAEGALRWPHLWSLAIEEHYYILYPLLFASLSRNLWRLQGVLIGVCVLSLVWRIFLVRHNVSEHYTYAATDTRLDSIAYGCLTALVMWMRPRWLEALRPYIWLALPIGVAIIVATLLYRSGVFRETWRYSLQGSGFFLIFLGMFTDRGLFLTAWLNTRPMKWLGQMSYAAYLWHIEPLNAFRHYFGEDVASRSLSSMLMVCIAGCAITFTIAATSHRLVYLPVLSIRRRFGSHAAPG